MALQCHGHISVFSKLERGPRSRPFSLARLRATTAAATTATTTPQQAARRKRRSRRPHVIDEPSVCIRCAPRVRRCSDMWCERSRGNREPPPRAVLCLTSAPSRHCTCLAASPAEPLLAPLPVTQRGTRRIGCNTGCTREPTSHCALRTQRRPLLCASSASTRHADVTARSLHRQRPRPTACRAAPPWGAP